MLTDDEMVIFRKHMDKHMVNSRCPVCENSQWQLGGPVASLTYKEKADESAEVGSDVFPFVLLVCATCSYVHQFLWLKVLEAGR